MNKQIKSLIDGVGITACILIALCAEGIANLIL